MRHTGILRSWNDERGFGFIAPTQGGREVFVHVSELPRDGTRPTIGETLSFEFGKNAEGKLQALKVQRQAFGQRLARRHETARPRAQARAQPRRGARWLVALALAITLGAYAVSRFGLRRPAIAPEPAAAALPPPDVRSTPAAPAMFRCDGRTHCSQMGSCAEATYFLKNCPGTQMDGNRDGVPCQQQWCTGLLGR